MPLALWLARPEWRALPIQVLAVDNAVQPMELGRDVMAAWGDILGQPVWQVRVERGSLEHMPRLERKLADTLERQERHLRPWLLTAANVLNELSAESRQMNREDDEDEEGSGGVRRLENLLDELEPLCWPAPLNEDETGSADEALLPAALFVEPGTRLGGKTISRLRDAALERDLMPLAPCTHRAPCPLAHAHAGRGWCHFTFDCEGAPQWLQELSSAAGLAKSALSLAPLLLRADPAAGESLFDDLDDLDDDAPDNSREAAAMLRQPRPVRVLSSPFVVPGLRGQARYACCAAGLAVVPDAAALPSGAQLTARARADRTARRSARPSTARAEPCCWPCPPSPAAAAARDVSRAPKNRAGTSVTGRRTDTGTSASAGAPTNATLPTAPSATAATATTASPAVTTGAGPRNDRPILRTGVPDGMKTTAVLTGTTAGPMDAALTGAPATGVTAMPPGEAVAAGRTSHPSCEGPATGKRVFIHMSAGLPHGRSV